MANGPRKPMRQGQQNRRGRGRGRKPQNPLSRNYESNGPDVKIRGSASHIAEKYAALAHDALSSGNMVAGESYLQHAEHYNRIIMANQVQQSESLNGSGNERARSDNPAEDSNGKQSENGKQPETSKEPEEAPASSPAAQVSNQADDQVSNQADDQTNNDEGVLRTLSRATKSNGSAVPDADKPKKKGDGDVEEVSEKTDAGEAPDEAVT